MGLADFIRERLRVIGKSPRDASIEATGSPDAIRNIFRGKSEHPRGDTLRNLARALRCPVEDLMAAMADEAEGRISLGNLAPIGDRPYVPVTGVVEAGNWREAGTWDAEKYEDIRLSPDPSYPIRLQFGVAVAGTSINKIAEDGQFLLCLGIEYVDDSPSPAQDGDLAIIERIKPDGSREATVKRLRRVGRDWQLHYESTDHRWRGFLRAEEGFAHDREGYEIRRIGRVLGVAAPE